MIRPFEYGEKHEIYNADRAFGKRVDGVPATIARNIY